MFCIKCGKEIKEGARFCTVCGHPVQVKPQLQAAKGPVKMQAESQPQEPKKAPQNEADDDKTLVLNPQIPNHPPQDTGAMGYSEPLRTEMPAQPGKKKKGILGLVIVLILLVFVALGCLFFIIYIQNKDVGFVKLDDTEQIDSDEDDEEDNDGEVEEEINGQFSEEDGETEEVAEEETDYMAQAQEAYDNNDYILALQCCSMALQQDSLNEDAYLLEADIYLAQQEFEQAAIVLSEGIVETASPILEDKQNRLLDSVIATSCSEYNSLGTLTCEIIYDSNGNAIRYTFYSDGKNISSIEECGYDSQGNNISKAHYNGSMKMEWQESYDYDSAGNMISCTHYNSKNRKEWTDQYTYDGNGRKIETDRYNGDGTLSWWDEYTYVSDEKFSKVAHPSTGQTVVFQYTSAYDQFGNQTEFAEYDASGNCTSSWTKEYNGLGDVTKYTYGDSERNYVYEYVYK